MNQNSLLRILNATGVFLLIINAGFAMFDIFPVQLLQPDWVIDFAFTFTNNVSVYLVGIALVHLSGFLSPEGQSKTQVRIARLAVLMALLYLLFLPMLAIATWRNLVILREFNKQQIEQINTKGKQLAQAIQSAESFDVLKTRLATLQGPQISDQAKLVPLPALKKQLVDAVKSAQDAAPTRVNGPLSPVYLEFYKRVARTGLLALVSAVAFAGLAWNPATGRNIFITYFQSIGLFGIKPADLISGLVNYIKTYNSRRQEAAELKNKRRSALLMQQRLSKAEAQQLREQKRQQIEDQKRSIQIRKERERMQVAEREMERKRQLELEKQRNQERKGK